MIVGVVKETFPGERRVALVPDIVGPLKKKGFDLVVESGAGLEAGFTDAAYEGKGAQILPTRGDGVPAGGHHRADPHLRGAIPCRGKADLELMRARADHRRRGRAAGRARADRRVGRDAGATRPRPRADPAHHAGAEHGRPLVDGHGRRLQGGAAGGRAPAEDLPHVDDRGRHRRAGQGVHHRRGRGRAAGDRHGQAPRARSSAPTTCAPRSRSRSRASAPSSSRWSSRPAAEDEGGYAQEMDEEFYRKQRELMTTVVAESDVVITTAAVPGKKAPILVTEEMVKGMAPGLGDRRPGRRARRQLRADEGRTRSSRSTASRSSARRTSPSTVPVPRQPDVREEHHQLPLEHALEGRERKNEFDLDRRTRSSPDTWMTKDGEVVHPAHPGGARGEPEGGQS